MSLPPWSHESGTHAIDAFSPTSLCPMIILPLCLRFLPSGSVPGWHDVHSWRSTRGCDLSSLASFSLCYAQNDPASRSAPKHDASIGRFQQCLYCIRPRASPCGFPLVLMGTLSPLPVAIPRGSDEALTNALAWKMRLAVFKIAKAIAIEAWPCWKES